MAKPYIKTVLHSARFLAILLTIILLLGTSLFYIDRRRGSEPWITITQQLATAFLMSFIVVLSIDLYMRRRSREDIGLHLDAITQNVWHAVSKRLLGSAISAEIEAMMKDTAAKENCLYTITFKRPEPEIPDNRVVVMIENSFRLRSLNDQQGSRIFHFSSTLSGFTQLGRYPRFTLFKMDGIEEELRTDGTFNSTFFARDIELPRTPDGRVLVTLGMELLYRLRDSEIFLTEVPIEGLQVTIVNLVPDLITNTVVDIIHRAPQILRVNSTTWAFHGAVLPGQGFVLSWNEAESLPDSTVSSDVLSHGKLDVTPAKKKDVTFIRIA